MGGKTAADRERRAVMFVVGFVAARRGAVGGLQARRPRRRRPACSAARILPRTENAVDAPRVGHGGPLRPSRSRGDSSRTVWCCGGRRAPGSRCAWRPPGSRSACVVGLVLAIVMARFRFAERGAAALRRAVADRAADRAGTARRSVGAARCRSSASTGSRGCRWRRSPPTSRSSPCRRRAAGSAIAARPSASS